MKIKDEKEWMKQAEYDFETAESNLKAGRYVYAVFMCHLSIEKALKSLFFKKFQNEPPKTHNLTYLINKTQLHPPQDIFVFVDALSTLSVPTRYPDDLDRILKRYNAVKTQRTLDQAKEVLLWAKKLL